MWCVSATSLLSFMYLNLSPTCAEPAFPRLCYKTTPWLGWSLTHHGISVMRVSNVLQSFPHIFTDSHQIKARRGGGGQLGQAHQCTDGNSALSRTADRLPRPQLAHLPRRPVQCDYLPHTLPSKVLCTNFSKEISVHLAKEVDKKKPTVILKTVKC